MNDNKITAIDVSKNTNLKKLELRNNQITMIDVSKNVNLGALSLSGNSCNENRLSSLKLSAGTISFSENTIRYNVVVDNSVTEITIEASLKSSMSSFVSGYAPGTKKLNVGKNVIEIKIKAEDGSIKTYTINVTRKEIVKSSNNYLSSIKLSYGNILFDKNKTEYQVTIPYDIDKLELDILKEDNKSTIIG